MNYLYWYINPTLIRVEVWDDIQEICVVYIDANGMISGSFKSFGWIAYAEPILEALYRIDIVNMQSIIAALHEIGAKENLDE